MSSTLLWNNLVAYSMQVLVVAVVGGILPWLLRVHQPRLQLLFLRLLLAACLLLPLAQPWHRGVVPLSAMPEPAPAVSQALAHVPPSAPATPPLPWKETILWAIGVGAAGRIVWLLIGLVRLGRLRAGSQLLDPLPEPIGNARLVVGAVAESRVSSEVSGPVTFGARNPVVLFPPSVFGQTSDAQFGIACHEFLHVRRRDWLHTVVEEFAGALVWFHPAVWWLLGQIRLAREQAVDQEVLSLASDRESYVQALLAMGSARPQLDLAPATLFLRKRHLASRVQSLLKEVTMSKFRLVSCYALTCTALVFAAWFTVATFPLEASPMAQTQGEAPKGVISVSVGPDVPEPALSKLRARLARFEGNAYKLDSRAEVLNAAREAESSARLLRMTQTEMLDGSVVTSFVVTARPDMPPLPASRMPSGTVHIDLSALPEPVQSAMRAKVAPYEGQPDSLALRVEVMRLLTELDRQARLGVASQAGAGGSQSTTLSITLAQPEPGASATVAPATQSTGRQLISADGREMAAKLVSQTRAVYPPLARQARIQGDVRFNALIDKEGRVARLAVVSGHPLLAEAAEAAVKQWVYQPTFLNGEPVEVATSIDVSFALQ